MRKPVFGVRHKPGCTVTEDEQRLESLDLLRKKRDCTIYIVKTKAWISCANGILALPTVFITSYLG